MNYFYELSIDLRSMDVLELRNVSAKMSNVSAKCSLSYEHLASKQRC